MHALLIIGILFLLPFPVALQADDTAELYAAWRHRIVQIQVIDQQADSRAGIGSGFYAGQSGWIVSNYHVISELINQPGRYRARFRAESGTEGELEILAVDAVHDLALMKARGVSSRPFPLSAERPPRGTRLWSMGYPFDIGLTIVEGTFNGMLEKSLYEKLHFTGSINPGMSGGPTLNRQGEVVGVNVSTAGNQVSFLVPARHVRALIASAGTGPRDPDQLTADVAEQLLDNQRQITEALLAGEMPKTTLEGYKVPAGLGDYISCWGSSHDEEGPDLAVVYYRCESQDDIFLSDSLSTSIIQYEHELLSTGSLHPLRFYRQLEDRAYYPQLRLGGDERSVSNYECRSDLIDRKSLELKATYCVRRYRDLEGLYDAYLQLTSLVEPDRALQSSLLLAGFSWENLTRLASLFVQSIDREVPEDD
jgi:hypothetical protein